MCVCVHKHVSYITFNGGEQLDLPSNRRQGVPADDILLTNLRCSGRESNLFQCEHIMAVDRGLAYPCNSQLFVMVNCTGSTGYVTISGAQLSRI